MHRVNYNYQSNKKHSSASFRGVTFVLGICNLQVLNKNLFSFSPCTMAVQCLNSFPAVLRHLSFIQDVILDLTKPYGLFVVQTRIFSNNAVRTNLRVMQPILYFTHRLLGVVF